MVFNELLVVYVRFTMWDIIFDSTGTVRNDVNKNVISQLS
jgi:hypothetical protein